MGGSRKTQQNQRRILEAERIQGKLLNHLDAYVDCGSSAMMRGPEVLNRRKIEF
jgi:hypothetical protein